MNQDETEKIVVDYHRVRKVRATHILLEDRITIMAFIECTDLHWQPHAASGHANFICLYKKMLNQDQSNSPQQCRLLHHRN
jgi:hypothetical protein